jgi:Ni2+-binding GTPase involved in maturation of urease and hydrogenase
VDDKLRILTDVKKVWRTRLTTVFTRQGHYASDTKALATYPPADISIERIGDLLRHDLPALLPSERAGNAKNTCKPSLGEKRVLVIDVGGTHVKILVNGQRVPREFS